MSDLISRQFVELVVEYPDPELCSYKEYRGKPYYSIKYIENGETYVGYGTYKPEVLSRYLREYFMPSAHPERIRGRWVSHIEKSREYIGTVLVNVQYDYWFCDTCSYRMENGQPTYNFCPNCGADMRDQEGEE